MKCLKCALVAPQISSNISPTVARNGHYELLLLMALSLQYGAIRRDKAQRLLG